MDIITLDFETYYDSKTYSLSKKNSTTQSYVDDERFEVIGVAVKKHKDPTIWFSGTHEETKQFLKQYDWGNSYLLAHNALFDATILAWKFNIHPYMILDTLSMARPVHGVEAGGSLKALAERYNLGEKGTEVINADGMRRGEFSAEQLARYGEYCINDVELTLALFRELASNKRFNYTELALIDMTIKMHTRPQFNLDSNILEEHLTEVKQRKEDLISSAGFTQERLRSDAQLAEILRGFNVSPPMKTSARTGKEAYAFAKSDEAFKELQEHEDERVQAVVAARLGVKTTIEESRTERFIEIAMAGGQLPVPLKYYGAITGRWAATGNINLQNLPRSSKLKKAIVAPLGYSIVGSDLSNIELRVGLYFANQMNKVALLGGGKDLYKDFASQAFGVGYDEVDDEQRFVGKTACIAEGELVLTERGLVPIEKIMVDDRVWDGVEWVNHDGLIYQGERDVITYQGLTATPDHKVYLEDGTPCEFGVATSKGARIAVTGNDRNALPLLGNYQHRGKEEQQSRRAIAANTVRLRHPEMVASRVIYSWIIEKLQTLCPKAKACPRRAPTSSGRADPKATKKSECNASKVHQYERQRVQELRGTGGGVSVRLDRVMRGLSEKLASLLNNAVSGSDKQQWALYAGKPSLHYSSTTNEQQAQYSVSELERKDYPSIRMGAESLPTGSNSPQMHTSGDDRGGDSSKSLGISTQQMQRVAQTKRKIRVYDLVNAGPRHRFTVSGVLVSNCLSLIYGTGAKKLRAQIKMLSGKDVGEEFAQKVVNMYRHEYSSVKAAWYDAGKALEAIVNNEYAEIGLGKLVLPVHGAKGILLPSNLYLTYPDLKKSEDEVGRTQWTYKTRKGLVHIHSAKCFQNVIQALARCVMGESMVRVHKNYPVGLTIHDALYCSVENSQIMEAMKLIVENLRRAPKWMPGIPLDAECGFGDNISFKMKPLEKWNE